MPDIPDVLVVEEVRYDFGDHPKYADDFVRDLLKLMIISKLNSTARNTTSKAYFQKLVSQVEGCEPYSVKYGQPLLYVKYQGVGFTDQKVISQFVRGKDRVEVTMGSVVGEFVRTFDALASASKGKVRWGTGERPDRMFALLDSFVGAICRLSAMTPSSPNSLAGRRFGIRNASVTRKSLQLEFLIDGQLNILELNPARSKNAVSLLFGKSEQAKAMVAIMTQ